MTELNTFVLIDQMIKRDNDQGYTLLELSMVLAIVLISGLIIAPRMTGLITKWEVEEEAQKLMTKIRAVQQASRKTQQNYGIQFYTMGDSYNIGQWNGSALLTTETVFLGNNLDLADGTYQSASPSNIVYFDHLGAPNTGGSVIVQDSQARHVATIFVDQLSGRVHFVIL